MITTKTQRFLQLLEEKKRAVKEAQENANNRRVALGVARKHFDEADRELAYAVDAFLLTMIKGDEDVLNSQEAK